MDRLAFIGRLVILLQTITAEQSQKKKNWKTYLIYTKSNLTKSQTGS